MFTFSTDGPSHSLGSTLHSLVIHAALVSGAVWGTREAITASPSRDPEFVIDHFVAMPDKAPGTPGTGVIIGDVLVNVPDVPPPIDLPKVPEGTSVQVCDARCLATPGLPGIPAGSDGDSISATTVLSESAVDERPELRAAGALRYPAVLAQAGIDGSVMLSFVIDQEGRVEAEGIEVISASHQGFIAAAKEAVLGSRFQPARKHHEPVRVRVRQTVTFKR